MKIALICDTHFGARGDHLGFLSYFEKFYEHVFFPELEKRNIKHIIHLGDLVDRRKYINFYTASRLRTCFLDRLQDYETHIIAGNHDVFYKNTNMINSLAELISNKYPNISFHIEPKEITLSGKKLLLLPWINSENEKSALQTIESSYASLCFGHLQLQGFEMHMGSVADHGLDPAVFRKFDAVYSGHFHHKSDRGNVHYLGAPYEITWADFGDPRGFSILDLETGSIEYVQNPYSMFHKVLYSDDIDVEKFDFKRFQNRYVKVIILKKENPYIFDTFVSKLEEAEPYDLQLIEDVSSTFEENAEALENAQDTITLLRACIAGLSDNIDKPRLEKFLVQLHNEASYLQA